MADDQFTFNDSQKRWASKRHQRVSSRELKRLLSEKKGRCALSDVPLRFNVKERTPQKGGLGCHPLSPAVDHIDPGNPSGGHQIVCYALNDLKGHLPTDCFNALRKTEAWKKLMQRWKEQAERDPKDREAFRRLLRPNATKTPATRT